MTNIDGGEAERLAPVVPLFDGTARRRGPVFVEDAAPSARGLAGGRRNAVSFSERSDNSDADTDSDTYSEELPSPADPAGVRDRLVRALGRRGMSVAEAGDFLRTAGLDREAAEAILDELQERQWLSDADLAEQLIHQAVSRRGAGRRAVAQVLAKRRIPRDVADVALASMPDDDAERAREFADGKARALSSLPPDVALRRLLGQLQRRGYPGNVAQAAARAALAAVQQPSGPRFR